MTKRKLGRPVRDIVRGGVWDSVYGSVYWGVVGSVWDSVRGSVYTSVGISVYDSVRGSVWGSLLNEVNRD